MTSLKSMLDSYGISVHQLSRITKMRYGNLRSCLLPPGHPRHRELSSHALLKIQSILEARAAHSFLTPKPAS